MAAPALGANAWVGWAKEATWGTDPGAGYQFYKLAGGESVRLNRDTYLDPSLGGASIEGVFHGTESAGGDIPLPVRYEGLELPWKHLFGLDSVTSAIVVDGYKHTFVPKDDLPIGLSVEMNRDLPAAKSFFLTGGKVTKGVWRMEKNAPLMFTASVFGKTETLTTAGTPSFPTAELMLMDELVLTTATFSGTVDVLASTIEFNNPVSEDRFDLGAGGAMKEPTRSDKRTVLGTIDGEFSEEAQYTDWTGKTEGQLIYMYTGDLIGTDYYNMVITINCLITARPPQVADAGPVRMQMAFHAFKDGSTPEIKIELTNTITTVP